jgi:hypothetical protein
VLRNSFGQIVLDELLTGKIINLPDRLNSGIYVAEIGNSKNKLVKKLVLRK